MFTIFTPVLGRGKDTFNIFTPVRGRGRGTFITDGVVRSRAPVLTSEETLESDHITENPPLEPQFSTPISSNENTPQQLRDLIGELGSQIGESIASRLLASQPPLTPRQPPLTPSQPPSAKPVRAEVSDTTIDLSKVSLVVRSDIKAPPMYRGDGDDKYSIQEWIDTMEVYLSKRGFSTGEQGNEILSHLLGRAKSIVKVGLKSSSSSGTVVTPETIYTILRRYFSETPGSCLPLADFYATQPTAKETLVDYWVRLNTAAETADRHLKRQGSRMDNMDAEIAMMFVRNCPDPSLACVFKCKPISKWSLTEVQEAIDEHQREYQVRKSNTNTAKTHALQVATAVTAISPPEPEVDYAQVNTVKCTSTNPTKPSEATASDQSALERVLSMLERVLERTSQPLDAARPQFSPSDRFTPGPCRVCGNSSHSTRTHCMRERRCLGCLEVGHQRKDCPKATVMQRGGSSPGQGN